jgi:hypothetical protein
VDLLGSMMFRQPTVAGQATMIEAMWNDETESMADEQVTHMVSPHERNI